MKTIVMGAPQAIPKCVFFEPISASVHEVDFLLGLKCHLEKTHPYKRQFRYI